MTGILTDEAPQARIVTTMIQWRHELDGEGHCLARLVIPSTATISLVLSELASNPAAFGISSDFSGAATAAWNVLGSYSAAPPQDVQWFAHHGTFSSYDPTGAEALTQVTLSYRDGGFHGDLRGHRLLDPQETAGFLASSGLEPVPAALARLHHTA